MKKVLFLGQLPPPYMGPSMATEIILNSSLNNEFELIHMDTSDHRDLKFLSKFDYENVSLALKQYTKLIYLILTKRPDIVYIPISQTTLGYLRDVPFIIISKVFGRKVVCHLRGGYFHKWYESTNSMMRWIVRCTHSLVDGQIVLGEKLKWLFNNIIPEKKIFVVPNGRDFEFSFNSNKEANKVKILYLSNLIRTKGVLDVLLAVPEVYKIHKNIEFIFAGSERDTEVKKEIDQFLYKNGYLPVRFIGPIHGKEKYSLYEISDIFTFPTYYIMEGHPWVIIEAMAAGLPIITTNHAAITESVKDGVNGFIVEKQNPKQIAEKIIYLIENPDIRKKMGEASRRLYLENFTEEKMVERMKKAFEYVLAA